MNGWWPGDLLKNVQNENDLKIDLEILNFKMQKDS